MNYLYKILDWDTNVFGYLIASIQIDDDISIEPARIIDTLKKDNVKLAYWFIKPEARNTILELQKFKGKLVDEKITYKKILSHADHYINPKEVTNYKKTEISQTLYKIAVQSSIYSRFRLDENFKNQEYLKLYHLWIKNSVNKTIATDVLVYIENKHEQGLITLNLKNNYGNIGLFSVDEKYRGKSVGKKLMQAAFSKMAHNNIQEISVSTQKANFPACHFYEYQGFILKNQINIYHLWL